MNMALMYKLTIYSGIAAIALLISTFTTGIFDAGITLHKNLALATLVAGICHGGLVVYRMIDMKSKKPARKNN